jgi:Kef-type K+ transport system membrane component KefB
MNISPSILLTVGGFLLLGLLASSIAKKTILPRVTILLLFGVAVGGDCLDLVPPLFSEHFDVVADITLVMIGFLIGGKLTIKSIKGSARSVFWISLIGALVTVVIVSLVLGFCQVPFELALMLGCIASATAPAAVYDVVAQFRPQGKFAKQLLSIVALDDIWGLVLFGLGLAYLKSSGGGDGGMMVMVNVARDLGGALVLGMLLGFPAAYLTGRAKSGEPILSEALGLVFVCGGIALWLEVSHLIAAMTMGCVIANRAKHHKYPFHALEGVESIFLVIFFVLAGVSLDLAALKDVGFLGAAYVLARSAGKCLGGWAGGHIAGVATLTKRWIGPAMLPQAGVAIGMALVASAALPEYKHVLLPIVIGSTVLFEIVGPVATRVAVRRVDG